MLCKLTATTVLLTAVLAIHLVPATVLAQDRATVRIAGKVVDNNNQPVSKVKISLRGRAIGESGNDGAFSVRATEIESRFALTFAAEGYVSNTQVFASKAPGNGNTIVVWPIAHQVKFDPSRELDIELNSSRIRIPANVLLDAGGRKLNEPVVLSFTLFDITNAVERSAASGDFSGQMTDGSIRQLNSYGIFDLDLQDQRGRRLTLSRGAKIDVSIAVPRTLSESAPRQVGFFNLDQRSGRWVQVDNFAFDPRTLTYNGSVTNFGGAKNLDVPRDVTCIAVRVVNIFNGSGMANFNVTAHGAQYSSSGVTNSSGFVCLLVLRNSTFTVSAIGTVGTSTWATPNQPTFMSPNFSSTAADCGNSCTTCPFLGTVAVDLIVGDRPPRQNTR